LARKSLLFLKKKKQKESQTQTGIFKRACSMSVDLVARKMAMRAEAIVLRNACDPALGVDMAKHVVHRCMPPPGAVVAGFWPLAHEIDIRPLLHALAAVSYDIVLPVTPERGKALTFRKWNVDDALLAGRYGTQHTNGPEMTPDFILVPLLGFDAKGNRLGYGAGYYDRTLAALPDAFRLGCAFAAQEFGEIPVGPEDVKLHAVVTEDGVKRFL
jgi:5-formyltetrahydrofolate cyclo-ligase